MIRFEFAVAASDFPRPPTLSSNARQTKNYKKKLMIFLLALKVLEQFVNQDQSHVKFLNYEREPAIEFRP